MSDDPLVFLSVEDGAVHCALGGGVEEVILDAATGGVTIVGELVHYGPRMIWSDWNGEVVMRSLEGVEARAPLGPLYLDTAERQGIPVRVIW